MSTETTNKKIKIDNGTTFGRTYTDKAVDELLKNAGSGGTSVIELTDKNGTIASTQLNEINANPQNFAFKYNGKILLFTSADSTTYQYCNNTTSSSENNVMTTSTLLKITSSTGTYTVAENVHNVVANSIHPANGGDLTNIQVGSKVYSIPSGGGGGLTFPTTSPTSQLIPSITTSNEQQNLTIGNGLEIKNGVLISNLSNFKYGTLYLKNITSNNISYTVELSFFDYIYDVIINGANQLMGTSLTRDTFPSFLKNNITPQLFTTLISNIINVHRREALMPYFDVTIIDQTNNAIFANCSTVIEGGVGFFCGTNTVDLSNITFGDTFTVEYYGSWYGD